MNKFLLAFFIAVGLVSTANAWTQSAPLDPSYCIQTHAPWGAPQAQRPDSNYICRRGYFLQHDNIAKIPVWVSWMVNPNTVNGCWPRTNAFVADQSLPPNKRSTPQDYAGSGYDQGHLANDAHQTWDQQTGFESFLMSNMSPQLPGFNRGIWKLLESATGAWVFSRQTQVIVFAGHVYDPNTSRKIGRNQVVVPDALYKIVVDTRTGEALAFYFPHQENLGNDLTRFQVTVADIERVSGIVFPMPPNTNKAQRYSIWPIDFKSVADAKRALCRR